MMTVSDKTRVKVAYTREINYVKESHATRDTFLGTPAMPMEVASSPEYAFILIHANDILPKLEDF